MSYILDALRRADAERERGAVPGVHTRQFSPPHQEQQGRRRSQWPLWTIVALSVALVAALAWNFLGRGPAVPAQPPLASLRPEALPPGLPPAPSPVTGTSLPPIGAASSATTAPSDAPAGTVAAAADTSPVPARTGAAPARTGAVPPGTGSAPASTGAALPPATRTSPAAPSPIRPTSRATTSPATAPNVAISPTEAVAQGTRLQPTPSSRVKPHPTTTVVASAEADPDQAVEPRSQPPAATVSKPSGGRLEAAATEQRELPESMRKELPPIAVSGSAYSPNKASRMLLANGQVFHEGDSVANGLVLQQIKPRAAVFDYKGYRYEMPF